MNTKPELIELYTRSGMPGWLQAMALDGRLVYLAGGDFAGSYLAFDIPSMAETYADYTLHWLDPSHLALKKESYHDREKYSPCGYDRIVEYNLEELRDWLEEHLPPAPVKGRRIQVTLTLEIELPCPLEEYVEAKNNAADAAYDALDRIRSVHPELKDFYLNWNS